MSLGRVVSHTSFQNVNITQLDHTQNVEILCQLRDARIVARYSLVKNMFKLVSNWFGDQVKAHFRVLLSLVPLLAVIVDYSVLWIFIY